MRPSQLPNRALWGALVACAIALPACEALGNPPSRYRTPETETQVGPYTLTTRTETVPSEHASELMRRIEGRPHHVDEVAAPFLTLVVVDVEPRGAVLPRYVSLATDLDFRAGPSARRRWVAPGDARPFVAVFGALSPPVGARTIRSR